MYFQFVEIANKPTYTRTYLGPFFNQSGPTLFDYIMGKASLSKGETRGVTGHIGTAIPYRDVVKARVKISYLDNSDSDYVKIQLGIYSFEDSPGSDEELKDFHCGREVISDEGVTWYPIKKIGKK